MLQDIVKVWRVEFDESLVTAKSVKSFPPSNIHAIQITIQFLQDGKA